MDVNDPWLRGNANVDLDADELLERARFVPATAGHGDEYAYGIQRLLRCPRSVSFLAMTIAVRSLRCFVAFGQ